MAKIICSTCGRAAYVHDESVGLCRQHEIEKIIRNGGYIAVFHDYYGCDTGCCGHRAVLIDVRGNWTYSDFSFAHFYGSKHSDGVSRPCDCDECQFILNMAGYFPEAPIHWDRCNLVGTECDY